METDLEGVVDSLHIAVNMKSGPHLVLPPLDSSPDVTPIFYY